MTFTIPNKALVYPRQSRIFQSDIDILQAAVGGRYGVLSAGCEITETTPLPDMFTDVAAGQVVINYSLIDVAGGPVSHEDADPLLPRFDSIVAADDGSVFAITGLADPAPFPESPTATQVGLGQVFVPAADVAIEQEQIVDKRIYVPQPFTQSDWAMLACTTDLDRANNAAIALDPLLQFTVNANASYRVRFGIWMHISYVSFTNGGLTVAFRGPTSVGASGWGATTTGTVTGSLAPALALANTAGTLNFSGFTLSGAQIGPTSVDYYLSGSMILKNGSTPGTFGFAWAQAQANVNPLTRRAGSWMEYEVAG
jgi:hypothetical protein